MSDPCKCQKCQDRINSHREFVHSHAVDEFIRQLAAGQIRHIGNDSKGRALYQDTR